MRMILLLAAILAAGAGRADPDLRGAGRLEDKGGAPFCSAVLIERDVVLTAAHCVALSEGADGAIRFRPSGPRDAAAVPVAAAVRHPLYDLAQSFAARKFGFDVAALKLARPVPSAAATPIPPAARGAREGETLFVLSWAGGADASPRHRRCTALSSRSGVVVLGCPARGGESGGAAIRLRADGSAEVVALTVSRGRVRSQPVTYGAELVGRVRPMLDLID